MFFIKSVSCLLAMVATTTTIVIGSQNLMTFDTETKALEIKNNKQEEIEILIKQNKRYTKKLKTINKEYKASKERLIRLETKIRNQKHQMVGEEAKLIEIENSLVSMMELLNLIEENYINHEKAEKTEDLWRQRQSLEQKHYKEVKKNIDFYTNLLEKHERTTKESIWKTDRLMEATKMVMSEKLKKKNTTATETGEAAGSTVTTVEEKKTVQIDVWAEIKGLITVFLFGRSKCDNSNRSTIQFKKGDAKDKKVVAGIEILEELENEFTTNKNLCQETTEALTALETAIKATLAKVAEKKEKVASAKAEKDTKTNSYSEKVKEQTKKATDITALAAILKRDIDNFPTIKNEFLRIITAKIEFEDNIEKVNAKLAELGVFYNFDLLIIEDRLEKYKNMFDEIKDFKTSSLSTTTNPTYEDTQNDKKSILEKMIREYSFMKNDVLKIEALNNLLFDNTYTKSDLSKKILRDQITEHQNKEEIRWSTISGFSQALTKLDEANRQKDATIATQ